MQESNGTNSESPELSPAPSAPDFNQVIQQAQATGDFDYVLETARKSHKMLLDFKDAIRSSSYAGKDAAVIGMGLNFLDNIIGNSAGQISALKQTEKATREAMRAAARDKKNDEPVVVSAPLTVIEPEKPAKPGAPEAPNAA